MHGDLSDRNILINPKTLEITGLIDWERANLAPAYFEWVVASLSNGHEPAWRFELLDFLRSVLRAECRQAISAGRPSDDDEVDETAVEALYKETLAAWNAFVNVERAAQGISDDCYWTFENELTEPPVYPEWEYADELGEPLPDDYPARELDSLSLYSDAAAELQAREESESTNMKS
jgi:hypothetical protein